MTSFVTPVDGQVAVAEHVAQLTDTLNGTRSIPVKVNNLTVTGGNLLFSPDNTIDIGASGANRPRDIFASRSLWGTSVRGTGTLSIQSGGATSVTIVTNSSTRWEFDGSGHLAPWTTNVSDIGSSSYKPRDLWLGRNLDVKGTATHPDLGADTPSLINQGMTAFGGRINIGGTGGADRIGWMCTGINTPSTTLMNGSTQTLWYAEYWSNDLNTGALNGMDFGCIGPPSAKVDSISLMRLRGVGARTLGPNHARGLLVESINNGTQTNTGVWIEAPGASVTDSYGIRNKGKSWLYDTVEFGTAGAGSRPYIRAAPNDSQALSIESPKYAFLSGKLGAGFQHNAYFDGTNWMRFNVADSAMCVQASATAVNFYSAPAGSNPISFAPVMTINSSGYLSVSDGLNVPGVLTAGSFRAKYWSPTGEGQTIPYWSCFVTIPNGVIRVYLPNGTGRAGDWVIIKNWSAAQGLITATGGQVIGMPDGSAPVEIAIQHGQAYMIMSDGGAGMMVVSRAV